MNNKQADESKEQKSKLESKQMREYIPKDEVLDIIKSMPMDLVEEYVYELDGIWLNDDGETSTNEGVAESATTTDCISRKQAIEALTGWETEPLDEDIVRTLESLPPVTEEEVDYCNNCPYIYIYDGLFEAMNEVYRAIGFKIGGDTE